MVEREKDFFYTQQLPDLPITLTKVKLNNINSMLIILIIYQLPSLDIVGMDAYSWDGFAIGVANKVQIFRYLKNMLETIHKTVKNN